MSTTPRAASRSQLARRAFLAATATLSAIVFVVSSFGLGSYFWLRARIETIAFADPTPGQEQTDVAFDEPCTRHPCNYLILGSDSRANLSLEEQIQFGDDEFIGGVFRSDTIIVVRTDPRTKRATILHFPRDLWVEIPGHGWGRINTAFEGGLKGGGPQLVARTIKSLTGLQIHHVLHLDLGGFQGVVDALGGVPMCVDRPLYDKDAGLDIRRAGCHTFDGRTALAYVRARSLPGDCIPDFARIARQQQFLRALLSKLLSPSEVVRLPSLVGELVELVTVDEGLRDITELAHLANQLNGVSTGNADFRVVPTVPASVYPDGQFLSVVRLVQPDARELFRRLRGGKPLGQLGLEQVNTPPSPANVRVAVVDAGSSAAARKVLSVLTRSGFDVSPGILAAGGQPFVADGAVLAFRPGAEEMAKVVRRFVPNVDLAAEAQEMPPGVDVALVVDAAFTPQPPGGDGSTPPPDAGC